MQKSVWNPLHYEIRAGAYVYARKEKRDGSNGNEGIFRHIYPSKKRKCIWYKTQVRFTSNARTFHFKRKDVSVQTQVRFGWNARAFFQAWKITVFRAHFQGNLSSPFRTSNFFFFHFLLYCKRKEYICLIHEKSFIKITTMNIEPHNLIDPLREKLPHLIRHEKQYRMIHRQLMKKWFQYFVLFFIISWRWIIRYCFSCIRQIYSFLLQ